jgi:hypothetical protein
MACTHPVQIVLESMANPGGRRCRPARTSRRLDRPTSTPPFESGTPESFRSLDCYPSPLPAPPGV